MERPSLPDGRDHSVGAAAGAETWALPDWETYSESCASESVGSGAAWSDVEADVSVDTSSPGSTQHQRIYREQRARRRPGERDSGGNRDLRELHLFYLQQRRQTEGLEAAVRQTSDRVRDGDRTERLEEQQTQIHAELQAVREQLEEFGEMWARAAPSQSKDGDHKHREAFDIGVQTDAVRQWLLLLSEKVVGIASDYEHGPTQSFYATAAHLAGLSKSASLQEGPHDNTEPPATAETSQAPEAEELFHRSALNNIKAMIPSDTADAIATVEKAVSSLVGAVRTHSQRQMSCFEQSIRQLQGLQNDRVQRVVDESISELKIVRGRYKKKEARLENELREANERVNDWQQKANQVEYQLQTTRDALERKMMMTNDQVDFDRRRYEIDLQRLRELLETAYAEREDAIGRLSGNNTTASMESMFEQVRKLQARCKTLIAQQESAKELYDRENEDLRKTINGLQLQLSASQSAEKNRLEELSKHLDQVHREEMQAMAIRVEAETRTDLLDRVLPRQVREVEERYAKRFEAMKDTHDIQVAELHEQIANAEANKSIQKRSIDIQTDRIVEDLSPARLDDEDPRIAELTRKCRALEKLLDKKFEDTSRSVSSSRLCASCHTASSLRQSNASQASSDMPRSTVGRRSSTNSKVLARALLSTSRSSLEDALFPDEEATADTEDATLAAEMWDSASFTSIDTMDDMSAMRPLPPRAPVPQNPSTQTMAALARKLRKFATTSSTSTGHREPDPELGSDPRVATAAAMSVGQARAKTAGDRMAAEPGGSSFDDLLRSDAL